MSRCLHISSSLPFFFLVPFIFHVFPLCTCLQFHRFFASKCCLFCSQKAERIRKRRSTKNIGKTNKFARLAGGNSSEFRLNMTILGRSNINILYLLCDLYALQLVFTCKFHQYAYLSGVDVDVSVEMREGREEIREEPTTVVDRAERNHSAQSLKWDSQMGGRAKKWLQTWDTQLYSIQIDC